MKIKTEANTTIEILDKEANQKEVKINGRSLGLGIVIFCSSEIKNPEMIEPSEKIMGNVLILFREKDNFPLYVSGPIIEIIEP